MTNLALPGHALAGLTAALLASSLAGAFVIAVVWLICRLFPRLPAGITATLWWMACARLLVGLVWVTPVALPVLPASATPPSTSLAARAGIAGRPSPTEMSRGIQSWPRAARAEVWQAADTVDGSPGPELATRARASSWLTSWPWRSVVAMVWMIAVAGFLASATRALHRHRRVVGRARRLSPGELPELPAMVASSGRLGVESGGGLPEVRASDEITSPQLLWVGRPVVLVPAALAERGGDALAWAICHELVHLRRRDHWSGLVVHAAERLFFFHPLVYLAAREFVVSREIACDAEVVRLTSAPPRDYGRLLVTLGIRSQRLRLAVAGAASSLRGLRRRLIMLQHVPSSPVSRWWRLVAIVAIAGVVPMQLVARRSPQAPVHEAGSMAQGAGARDATIAAPDGLGAFSGEDAVERVDQVAPPPPPPPPPPAPPAPPPPPPDGHGFAWVWSDNGESWAYVSGDAHVSVHGSSATSARLEALRKQGTPFFWFERGGKEYVIRDAATLKQVEALLAPMEDAGSQQGHLGAKQADLGARQAELAAKQAAIAGKQAALAAQQARHERADEATRHARTAVDSSQESFESQMAQLEREMEQLERELEPLADKQEELAKVQEQLGQQQEALARLQEQASKRSQEQLRALMEKAISSGTAGEIR